ncbi:MAG: QueT transporter family protein [Clostridia bacterium]|nr:QueT transporter family protein [Clostridia bacterium]
MKRNASTLFLCQAALIAALYVILTLVSRVLGLDSGVIQVRFSEMLCLLPIYFPAAIPGVTVGCFLANLLSGAVWLDLLVGPIATLIGAVGTRLLRKWKLLAPLPPIFANTILIPFVLAYGYGIQQAIPLMMLTVGLGEVISIYGLGMLMVKTMGKTLERL